MKILISVILIAIVASAQSAIQTAGGHSIPFASSGNRIELSVSNTSAVPTSNVVVAVTDAPSWVKFMNQRFEISNLKSSEALTAQFTFSVDKSAPINKPYALKFSISSPTGERWTKEIAIQVAAPEKFELFQNYPNPFNPSTTLEYTLPKASTVSLKVYDILGRRVATLVNDKQEAGLYSVAFDATRLSSGIYIYKLTSDKFSEVKKMMLVK